MSEEFLTTKEMCEKLKISRNTLQIYIKKGMPREKLGERLNRFKYSDVMEWIEKENNGTKKNV